MPNVKPDDVLKIRTYCTLGNQASVTTWHYHVLPAALVGTWDLALVLTDWANVFAPLCKPAMCLLAHFDGSSIQSVMQKPYSALIYSNQGNGNGTATGNPCTPAVAGMISRRSPFAGPSGRGRVYWPFPSTNAFDTNGAPALPYITLLTNVAQGVEPPLGLTFTSASNSIRLDPVIRNKSGGWVAISGHEYPLKFGTQHRRGAYGKPNFSPSMVNPS